MGEKREVGRKGEWRGRGEEGEETKKKGKEKNGKGGKGDMKEGEVGKEGKGKRGEGKERRREREGRGREKRKEGREGEWGKVGEWERGTVVKGEKGEREFAGEGLKIGRKQGEGHLRQVCTYTIFPIKVYWAIFYLFCRAY